jgi:feruloyl esterase
MMTLVALALAGAVSASPCEALKSAPLKNARITSAQLVPAGPWTPQVPAGAGRGGPGAPPATPTVPAVLLPAHCKVAAVLTPSSDSHIEMEVWLPAETWNGKFQAVGNGGWAGVISYGALATALQEGYATASNDTGHKGGNALFAIGHPEKLTDFAYRAVHEMTVQAKVLVEAYYGRASRFSYWNGCSTGGRQGLMSAQKYPADFDAIVAGAPANYQTHLHAWDLSVSVPVLKDPAAAVPPAMLEMVNKAVVAACDAHDGVTDGLLTDPRACTFDVATLQCSAGETSSSCLTAPQVASLKRVYTNARTDTGLTVFPGKDPGSEVGWNGVLSGQQAPGVSVGSFQVAYQNANWDAKTFNMDRDLKAVDEKVGAIVNAVDPDLSAFKARGGKLLLYHGWNDTAISARNSINYAESVQQKMGGNQDAWMRLFMAPGMQHCGGGVGPNQVNWMGALERWREAGVAPNRLEAAHVTNNRVDMTRPLCPYPQVATYSGSGSTNDAASFVCRLPAVSGTR